MTLLAEQFTIGNSGNSQISDSLVHTAKQVCEAVNNLNQTLSKDNDRSLDEISKATDLLANRLSPFLIEIKKYYKKSLLEFQASNATTYNYAERLNSEESELKTQNYVQSLVDMELNYQGADNQTIESANTAYEARTRAEMQNFKNTISSFKQVIEDLRSKYPDLEEDLDSMSDLILSIIPNMAILNLLKSFDDTSSFSYKLPEIFDGHLPDIRLLTINIEKLKEHVKDPFPLLEEALVGKKDLLSENTESQIEQIDAFKDIVKGIQKISQSALTQYRTISTNLFKASFQE